MISFIANKAVIYKNQYTGYRTIVKQIVLIAIAPEQLSPRDKLRQV